MSRPGALLAAVLLVAAVHALAAPPAGTRSGAITISEAWTRPTAAGMPMGVAYFVVRNDGGTADTIVSASTPVAARVEFHQTTLSGGMARMRPLKEIAVPAGSRVAVAPGGIHLMLVDLTAPLAAGTRVPLVLEFRHAGTVRVELSVEARSQ